MSQNNGDRLQQVKGSDEKHWARVIYCPQGPRQRAVTKQLHAQLGVTSRPVISSSPSAKRNVTVRALWKDMLQIYGGTSRGKPESSWGVTPLQIVLHLLLVISEGVKSEKCWERLHFEDSPHSLDSGNGKTKSMHTLVTQAPEIIGSLKLSTAQRIRHHRLCVCWTLRRRNIWFLHV